jgi:hypothetical protein
MKKTISVLTSLLLIAALLIGVTNCKEDEDEPIDIVFALSTLMAGDIDLNGATSANNVASNPTITATFNNDVVDSTVSAAVITLTRDYDDADMDLTITVAGKTITIVPTEGLGNGALYKLSFKAGIKAIDGDALAAFDRTFTTTGNFVPDGVIAYWSFEDNADDQVGNFDPAAADVIDVTYAASRNANAGKAASFNGSTTLIEVPNGDVLMNTGDFTISFWVKTNSADKTNGHFVMGLAGWNGFQYEVFGGYDGSKFAFQYELADGTTAAEDMWFPALADLGWQGWTYAKSLTVDEMIAKLKDNWLHITYTYNAADKVGILYFDGEKMKSFDFNLWPAGDAKLGVVRLKYNGLPLGNNLAFGFIQGRNNRTITDSWADYADVNNNHFKGMLDDVRIFHKTLTGTEIDLMYQSEKP